MFCKKCGTEMLDGGVFCQACGCKQDIEEELQAPVEQYQAPEEQYQTPVEQYQAPGYQTEQFKFCHNCGAQIPADSRFCPECRVGQHDSAGNAANVSPEKARNRVIGLVFASIIVLCLVIGVATSVIKPSININKYVTVTFEGTNDEGSAYVEFDYEKFEKDYDKKFAAIYRKKLYSETGGPFILWELLFKSKGMSDLGSGTSRQFANSFIYCSVSKSSGLSNGDTVTLSIEGDDEYVLENYGYKLKYKDVDYTVSGLKNKTSSLHLKD